MKIILVFVLVVFLLCYIFIWLKLNCRVGFLSKFNIDIFRFYIEDVVKSFFFGILMFKFINMNFKEVGYYYLSFLVKKMLIYYFLKFWFCERKKYDLFSNFFGIVFLVCK